MIRRTLLLFAICVSCVARAEPPDWEAFRDVVFVTRLGWFFPIEESFNGIWAYNPTANDYRRLRPFLPTVQSDGIIPHGYDGRAAFLFSNGDTLTYSTWPIRLDFDIFSWRFLRRLPSSAGLAELGWVVQGPSLSESVAAQLGLTPGIYGIVRCERVLVTGGTEVTPRTCGDPPFPGVIAPEHWGDDAAILQQESRFVLETTLVTRLPEFDWQSRLRLGGRPLGLSVDFARGGFWRPAPAGAQFLPIENGTLAEPEPPIDFGLFSTDEVEVSRLFYHEASGYLLGTAHSVRGNPHSDERRQFRWRPDTRTGEIVATWPSGLNDGAPDTFAAVRDQPSSYVQTVPIVGGGPGRNGTDWTTDVWLFNPSTQAMTVTLRRVTHPGEAQTLTLAAHGSISLPDVLAWLGGGPTGDGTAHEALVVTSPYVWGTQLRIDGRISTPDPETGGRYGHAVPAVPGTVGYSNHLPYRALQESGEPYYGVQEPMRNDARLDLDLREPERFRYNLGVVNDADEPLRIQLIWGTSEFSSWYTEWLRPPESTQEFDVPPHTVRLVPVLSLFPDSVRMRWPPRISVVGERPAVIWLSMVDNTTGDATFVPFTSLDWLNDNFDDRLVLPAVARTHGREGSQWSTDLYGYRTPFDEGDSIGVMYWPEDPEGACAGAAGAELGIEGEIGVDPTLWAALLDLPVSDAVMSFETIFPDVISSLEGCAPAGSSKGALEIATAIWNAGFSRTYTTRPDGGTYGAMLPLYPPHGWPVQHFAGLAINDDQRINLGLYNGLEQPVTNRLLIYAADGTLVASRDVVLNPHEHHQEPLERLVGPLPDGLYGLAVLPLDDADVNGRSWAYVSIVDNHTNDPINLW